MTSPAKTGIAIATLAAVALTGKAAAAEPRFTLPIDCTLGETCFVQSYVDLDPTPAARDYRCGSATYDGHNGTDIRLLSTRVAQQGVAVLAAAPGTVKAVRATMPDRLITSAADVPKGRECGNGVVIDHGNGWETQYCHMRRGSITVRRGQAVRRGAHLGLVGYSGKTQFAHLHLSVSKDGRPIDPFSNRTIGQRCDTPGARSLWSDGAAPAYADAVFIDAGFADAPVSTRMAETGEARRRAVDTQSPALLFYARILNIRAGDRLHLKVAGPNGFTLENTTAPLPRNKAQYIAFTGRRLRARRWPAGHYRGEARLLRDGKTRAHIAGSLGLQ